MTEQIKQRIKYLVEHGGIADDPLAEVKRMARQVQHTMGDPRSIEALDVAERYASGEATPAELNAARSAARSAAHAAAQGAAQDAAWAAARSAHAIKLRGICT